MTDKLDRHGTWGTWDLDRFEPEINDWRARDTPPDDVFNLVNQWWPLLEHPDTRAGAYLVDRYNSNDSAPDETDVYGLWVPRSECLVEGRGLLRVQCLFRLHQLGEYRVECAGFRSVVRMSQTEVDLADGMG